MSKNIKAVATHDYNAVIDTASRYVEGLREGSVATIKQAFHEEAVMYGFTNGQLLGGPISNLYDFVEATVKQRTSRRVWMCWRLPRLRLWCGWIWRRTRLARITTTT